MHALSAFLLRRMTAMELLRQKEKSLTVRLRRRCSTHFSGAVLPRVQGAKNLAENSSRSFCAGAVQE